MGIGLMRRGRDPRVDGFHRHAGTRRRPEPSRPVPGRGVGRGLATGSCSTPRRPNSASRSRRPGCVPMHLRCLAELASHPDVDVVLNAVVGFAGLPATLAALEHGKRLALANKESLIAGGPVVAAVRGARERRDRPRRQRALRASTSASGRGGRPRCAASSSPPAAAPSAAAPASSSRRVTVTDALAPSHVGHGRQDHHRLLDAHEQGARGHRGPRAVRRRPSTRSTWWCTRSRSCTAWSSSSTARRSPSSRCPTCACPIGLALGAPDRLPEAFGAIDWTAVAQLTFETPDLAAFPCLRLAFAAGRAGGGAPAVLERRQRGRGRGVPRRPDPVDGHRRGRRPRCSMPAPGTS